VTSVIGGATAATGRDPVMDFTRVLCVCLVVVGHLLMIGASLDSTRGLLVQRTLLDEPWFGPLSWVVQIMPLFFVVGGFVGISSWRRLEASGGTAADFIRSRVLRLARPAVPLFIVFAIGILVLRLSGVPSEAVSLIGLGVASPLWFLAAYTFAQAYLPTLATLHGRFPRATLAALAVAAVLFDVLRFATGVEAVGILNMIFVWLFVQQLGFWLADGWFERIGRPRVFLLGAAAYLLLTGLVIAGYPGSMLDNLNPPTVAIIAMAAGQVCLLVLATPGIRRLMRMPALRAVVAFIGARLMTVYLWHLPVIALTVGILLLTPLPTPPPGSAAWWWTRPLILTIAVLVLWALSAAFGRLERAPVQTIGGHAPDWATGLAAALMVLPPDAIMVFGIDFVIAALSAIAMGGAVWLQRPVPVSLETQGPDPVTP
jgi:fucose 4-O-acetylase-like acetyltransferase